MPRTRRSRLMSCFTAFALLLLGGCAEEKGLLDTISGAASLGPTSASAGNPSGDATGDPTEGEPTEGGTTGGAQGDCGQYLQCVEAIAPESLPEVEQTYGAGGVCWQSPETTQQCLEACTTGLASYGLLFPDEPACGGASVDPTTTTMDPSTTGDSSTSTTGDSSTKTTGDSSTSTTGDSSTSTTGSTTAPDTDTDTGGEDYGNCGWNLLSSYYACGSMGASPDLSKPIACPPNLPTAGNPCGSLAVVGVTGCCAPVSGEFPHGANYWCSNNVAQVQTCM